MRARGPLRAATGALAILLTDTGSSARCSKRLENADANRSKASPPPGRKPLLRLSAWVLPQIVPVLLSQDPVNFLESNRGPRQSIGAITVGGIGLLLTPGDATQKDWEEVDPTTRADRADVMAMDSFSGWLPQADQWDEASTDAASHC